MKRLLLSCSILGLAAALSLALAQAPATDDGQWLRPAKDFASTRYSSLDAINTGNVAQLKLAFNYPTGLHAGHEAAPLIADNTMFVVGPYPNPVWAFDLAKP